LSGLISKIIFNEDHVNLFYSFSNEDHFLSNLSRKLEDLNRVCDEKTEEFKQLEQQDTRIREDLRHANGQTKKLEKSLQVEQKKVHRLIGTSTKELTIIIN